MGRVAVGNLGIIYIRWARDAVGNLGIIYIRWAELLWATPA